MITPGDTFLIPTPPDYEIKHLYIVAIVINDDEVLLVNITTQHENSDSSCVLTIGDHDFIDRDSVISYKDAIKTNTNILEMNVKNGKISPRKPVSRELLDRILKGASNSKFLPEELRQYIPI
jgi:hypothetical protein